MIEALSVKIMDKAKYVFLVLIALCCPHARADQDDARANMVRFMEKVGLDNKLKAPVLIASGEKGLLGIRDEGSFVAQYMIATPAASADPNIVVAPDVRILPAADKAVIVTHGWVDKGASDWPGDIARALSSRTDPNNWVCAYFDWKGGAAVVNPADAAKYGRDIGGPRLVAALAELPNRFRHVHFIGHSAGSWTVNSAAKLALERLKPETLHITFLDAYVPPSWNAGDLADTGQLAGDTRVFVDHYFTKDITSKVTHTVLPNSVNVDITAVDPWFKEHEFPYRWYHASITGGYGRFDEKKSSLQTSADGVEYGFKRSLEAGAENFQRSLKLKKGEKPVKMRPKRKLLNFDFFKKR